MSMNSHLWLDLQLHVDDCGHRPHRSLWNPAPGNMPSQRYPADSPKLIRSPSFSLGNQSQMLSKEQQRNEARDRHEEARPFGGGNYR